jgi:uncharacterized protein (DUF3820 family)
MSKLFTAEDNNIMAWGKYKGQYLSDIPDRYIIWSWEETDLKDHVDKDTEKGSIARYMKLAYSSITK